MSSINKVLLVGRLSKDVEFRTTPNGNSVCDFSIAVDANQTTTNKDEKAAYFFKVTAWSKTAEFCKKYLFKGDLVGVDGSLVQRTYENKDGVKMTAVDINASKITLLSHKNDKAGTDEATGFIPDADNAQKSNSVDEQVGQATSSNNEKEESDTMDIVDDDMPWN